jgi:signal transduction histidine kinase
MHERAEAIGAQLSIDSRPGEGTRIELAWRAASDKETL